MKKSLLTICIAAFTACAFAQTVRFSFKAGADLATLHYSDLAPQFNVGGRVG